MQAHPLHQGAGSAQAAPGNGTRTETPGAGRTVSARAEGLAAGIAATAGMLAGLWVAISPWFLVLQSPRGGNTTAGNLIIGLAVAGLCLLTITGARGAERLQGASLLSRRLADHLPVHPGREDPGHRGHVLEQHLVRGYRHRGSPRRPRSRLVACRPLNPLPRTAPLPPAGPPARTSPLPAAMPPGSRLALPPMRMPPPRPARGGTS